MIEMLIAALYVSAGIVCVGSLLLLSVLRARRRTHQ